jgi:uncharacterized DUF497 family protein
MTFEWDEEKAAANVAKHGIRFDYATRVFLDPYRIEMLDDREEYGEGRYKTIGIVESRALVVIYTIRNGNIRLISARRAERYEQRHYHEI